MVFHKDLLFNIYLCVLFYFFEDLHIPSSVDDTTIYIIKEKESAINTSEALSLPLFSCFNNNFMKANSDKIHLPLSCCEPSAALVDYLSNLNTSET